MCLAPKEKILRYVNSITPIFNFDVKHTCLSIYEKTVEIHWQPTIGTTPSTRKKMAEFYGL